MSTISVIVPVYKVEPYLRRCVDSILAQTFSDIEIILVDDGSPDDCGAICDEYAKKDDRVRVIHQENGGVSAARNAGIRAAGGEQICFVDGDDLIHPDFCSYLSALLNRTECDYAACEFSRFDNENELERDSIPDQSYEVYNSAGFLEKQMKSGFSVCGKLFRCEVFDKVSFKTNMRHEDVILPADLARFFHSGVCFTEAKLYFYRQNTGGFMEESKKRCSPDRIYAGEYLFNTVSEICPEIESKAFTYAVKYPWYFVDRIYVKRDFENNRQFLKTFQRFLKDNKREIEFAPDLSSIVKKRMRLFANSSLLYGFNAYARLARVYLYKVLGKDAYKDGHGI